MPIFRIMFLLALLAFGVVWIRIEVNRSGRTIGQLQNEVEIKEARNQYLKLEILRLTSPETVSQQAREKFGFEPIKPHHVIVLEK
ncbi:MAG: septum formation initiator family protein [Elusimicrobiaceae bacterium]|nr:septum formation initiator family protein [Elusimicrobiaceae bacterium]